MTLFVPGATPVKPYFPVKVLLTVQAFYWLPDHEHILGELTHDREDEWPTLPRLSAFVNHWHHHIDATLHEVHYMVRNDPRYSSWRRVDLALPMN
jgi:uncharacterized protein Usg